jgi:hypothetical protein
LLLLLLGEVILSLLLAIPRRLGEDHGGQKNDTDEYLFLKSKLVG